MKVSKKLMNIVHISYSKIGTIIESNTRYRYHNDEEFPAMCVTILHAPTAQLHPKKVSPAAAIALAMFVGQTLVSGVASSHVISRFSDETLQCLAHC